MACEPGESCLLLGSENYSGCLHMLYPQLLTSDCSERCLECGLTYPMGTGLIALIWLASHVSPYSHHFMCSLS